MTYRTKRVTEKQIHTTDQKLLQEIRDHIEALPLASQISQSDVDVAKELRSEIAEMHERLERAEQVNLVLARAAGIHPEALDEDELALLAVAGAAEEETDG